MWNLVSEQLELLAPMGAAARESDPPTSHAAADAIEPSLGALQRAVVEFYRLHGPQSARQAERRSCFAQYSPSTIRKRISELHQAGLLVVVGTETESGRVPATVYAVAG